MERLNIIWTRGAAPFLEDVIVTTVHFTPATGLLLDPTKRQAVEDNFTTAVWTPYKAKVHTQVTLAEFRWYDQQIWPIPSPFIQNRVASLPGTSGGSLLPYQVSCSLTLQTQFRARWGRMYMPGMTTTSLDATAVGRWKTADVDVLANGAKTWLDACKTAGAFPVVYSPRGGAGPPAFAAGSNLPVTSVRVDDIPDIVRSRRVQASPYRKINALA